MPTFSARQSKAATLLVGVENAFSPHFQKCIQDHPTNNPSESSPDKGFVVRNFPVIGAQVLCTVRLVDKHNGFFAALAAFAIAIFTYTLDWSTSRLWKAEERNFRAAQRAFVS